MFGLFHTKRHPASRTPVARRLSVSRLDDRSLPSVSAAMAGDTLVVTGSQTGPMADQIRVIGDPADHLGRAVDLVRVYDGQREVGAFAGVHNIDVRPGGNSTAAVSLNGYRGINAVSVQVADPGTNSIYIGPGAVNMLT